MSHLSTLFEKLTENGLKAGQSWRSANGGCVESKSAVLLAAAQLTHLSSSGDTSELYLTSKHWRESPGLAGKLVRVIAAQWEPSDS